MRCYRTIECCGWTIEYTEDDMYTLEVSENAFGMPLYEWHIKCPKCYGDITVPMP